MTKRSILQNVSWLAAANIAAKILGLGQTVLLARVLGVNDYGVFGFIVGTLGLTAAVAGLQLSQTSTVFVAQHRETDPEAARRIVTDISRLTLVICTIAVALTAPASPLLTRWLIGPNGPTEAVFLATFIIPLTIAAGVLDGIAKGFEDFRSVAAMDFAQSVLSLIAIYPASLAFGVTGAVGTIGLTLGFRILGLWLRVRKHVRLLPRSQGAGGGPSLRAIISNFALPSVLTTFAASGSTWFGSYLLSRRPGGFADVALVNVGIQWRTPIILLASVVGSVAIPAMSVKFARGVDGEVRALKLLLLKWTGIASGASAILIAAGSPLLLEAYGKGFTGGSVVLSLIVASAVPQVIANTHLQQMLAEGRAWKLLRLSLLHAAPSVALLACLVGPFGDLGYAIALLTSWTLFAIMLTFLDIPTRPSP